MSRVSSVPNQVTGKRGPAFDRELLYLAAAFDMYGRSCPLLIDPTRDPLKFRQSLDASDPTAGRYRRVVRRARVVLAV